MVVWFDDETKTEANYDYVAFYRNADKTDRFGEEKYSGGRGDSSKNWPTLKDPLIIPSNECTVTFNSDNSNVSQGGGGTLMFWGGVGK